jgi:phospholipase/carboxylesterase
LASAAAQRSPGLLLQTPERFTGGAILYGTLPFDAGVPVTAGRLADVNVFVAQGNDDPVIPRELLDRSWEYITGDSGAKAVALRHPGGHDISQEALDRLVTWIRDLTESRSES